MNGARRVARRFSRAAALALVCCLVLLAAPRTQAATGTAGPHTPRTPIKHFVFLFQENHTFDNYFGTRGGGVDGIPAGTCMPVAPGHPEPCVKPHWIGDDPHRRPRAHADPVRP